MSSNERVASVLAGGLAIGWGLSSRSLTGKLAAAGIGSGLLYRGLSGHCHAYQALGIDRAHDGPQRVSATGRERAVRGVEVRRSVTVQQSAPAAFRAWRDPEVLALAMSHLASIRSLSSGRTQWMLHDSLGGEPSLVSEVVAEEPDKMIRWQTLESGRVIKNLTLALRAAPGDRGTEMMLHLRLEPPTGVLGALLSKTFGKSPAKIIDRALANVKSLLEAGELPSLKNNPAARTGART